MDEVIFHKYTIHIAQTTRSRKRSGYFTPMTLVAICGNSDITAKKWINAKSNFQAIGVF